MDKLLSKFINAAILHGESTLKGNSKLANKAQAQIVRSYKEIKKQDNFIDALIELLKHENSSVKCWAATFLLLSKPKLAQKALKEIYKNDKTIIGFSAEAVLQEWEKGNILEYLNSL